MFWRRNEFSLIPLGGINGVGHNCFLYVSKNSALVVDCGINPKVFKEKERIPDVNLIEPPPHIDVLDEMLDRGKSAAGIITHAHLDHIGAVRELGRRKMPVYLSCWSKLFMEKYSDNLEIPAGSVFRTFSGPITHLRHNDLEICLIQLPHSIPGTHGVLVRAGNKNIMHLGDFKFNGEHDTISETRNILQGIVGKFGKINCLVLDVLNSELEGFAPPERQVFDSINEIIASAKSRVIITCFSSNIQRIREMINIARANHRTVGALGRGMKNAFSLLGRYYCSREGGVLLTSGSQGEENSGLFQMVLGNHAFLRISPRDTVVLSSRCIPGNENDVRNLLEMIHKRGAKIILHNGESKKLNLSFSVQEKFLHVSGHGHVEDILSTIEILKPEIIIPFHAEPEKYDLFEDIVGKKKVKRLLEGERLEI